MSGPTKFGSTNSGAFSTTESRHLLEYLADVNPQKPGRLGNAIYKKLVENPDVWPWARTRSWQSWRHHYVKNEILFDSKIKKLLKNSVALVDSEETLEKEAETKTQNLRTSQNTSDERAPSFSSTINTGWINEEDSVSRMEDLPRQQSKAQNVPAPIGKSSEASTSKAVAQNVEKAVVRKNVSDMEDDSPGRPRGEILAAATQSSSNYQDNSMDRSKLHGYKTPPPSRSRSRSHSVEVENNASRLASPVTKSDNQTLHRSDLHNKVRLDAVTASKTASSLVADSGSSQKNVQLVSQGRSQNKSIKSSDQTSSSQKNKKSHQTSNLSELPLSRQGLAHLNKTVVQKESASGVTNRELSLDGLEQYARYDEDDDTNGELEEVNQETNEPDFSINPTSDADFDFKIDLGAGDTPSRGYGHSRFVGRGSASSDEELATELNSSPDLSGRAAPGSLRGIIGRKEAGKTRIIFPESGRESLKRKRKRNSGAESTTVEKGPEPIKDNTVKRPRKHLHFSRQGSQSLQKQPELVLLGGGRSEPPTAKLGAMDLNNDIANSSKLGLELGNSSTSYFAHRRRHTFGGAIPAPLPVPASVLPSPERPGLPDVSSISGLLPMSTSTPTHGQDHHQASASSSSSAAPYAWPPASRPSTSYPLSEGAHSQRPFDLSHVTNEDISLALSAALGSLASMHEFSIETVRSVWEEVGSLEEADKVLMAMRNAAEEAKQRALIAVRGGQNSRATSISREGTSSRDGAARRSSLKSGERRKSNLSTTFFPPIRAENEDEDAPPESIQEMESSRDSQLPIPPESNGEEMDQSSEVRRMITFHPSPNRKRPSDGVSIKKQPVWTEEEDAIIREADPTKLKELAKVKGGRGVRRRMTELVTS